MFEFLATLLLEWYSTTPSSKAIGRAAAVLLGMVFGAFLGWAVGDLRLPPPREQGLESLVDQFEHLTYIPVGAVAGAAVGPIVAASLFGRKTAARNDQRRRGETSNSQSQSHTEAPNRESTEAELARLRRRVAELEVRKQTTENRVPRGTNVPAGETTESELARLRKRVIAELKQQEPKDAEGRAKIG